MKTIRLILLLAALAGLALTTSAAERVTVRGMLIAASNEKGESDRRLAQYESNLRRILRFESFRYLGEDSAALGVPGNGELSVGEGHTIELATESSDGKTVLLKVRWAAARVSHEYVLQRGVPTILGGPSTGRKGEMYAVILVSR